MTNPPTFTVAPTSTTGHSLLQWTVPGKTGPTSLRSIDMETEIAEYLARCANEYTDRAADAFGDALDRGE